MSNEYPKGKVALKIILVLGCYKETGTGLSETKCHKNVSVVAFLPRLSSKKR